MDYLEIIVTAIVSAGIPSAVCGLLIKRYVGRLDQRDAARAEEAPRVLEPPAQKGHKKSRYIRDTGLTSPEKCDIIL